MKQLLYGIFNVIKKRKSQGKWSLVWALIKLYYSKVFFPTKTDVFVGYAGKFFFAHSYSNLDYVFNEIFVGDEYSVELNDTNPVIFDCGSNIGCSVLFFKKKYSQAQVFAFEPQPLAFKYLEKNVAVNSIKDVTIYNVALSDSVGLMQFFIPDNGVGFGASISESRQSGKEILVNSLLLSSFTKQFEKIDLVKIDVEGAESQILRDLVNTGELGKKKIQKFIIEFHHNISVGGYTFSEFLSFFEENGYNYNIVAEKPFEGVAQDILIYIYLDDKVL